MISRGGAVESAVEDGQSRLSTTLGGKLSRKTLHLSKLFVRILLLITPLSISGNLILKLLEQVNYWISKYDSYDPVYGPWIN